MNCITLHLKGDRSYHHTSLAVLRNNGWKVVSDSETFQTSAYMEIKGLKKVGSALEDTLVKLLEADEATRSALTVVAVTFDVGLPGVQPYLELFQPRGWWQRRRKASELHTYGRNASTEIQLFLSHKHHYDVAVARLISYLDEIADWLTIKYKIDQAMELHGVQPDANEMLDEARIMIAQSALCRRRLACN